MKKIPNEVDMTLAVMMEVGIVIILCMIILARMPKHAEQRHEQLTATPTEQPTATPTVTPTPTATPTPEPTSTPTPTEEPVVRIGVVKEVAKGHTFKPYTSWTAYNIPNSAQNRLQKVSRTAENGVRIVTDPDGVDRYHVALGTYWAGAHPEHIGRCVDVYMVNGTMLPCVLADVKRQEDTKKQQNRYGEINNDILEFIVDMKVLPAAVKQCGNCSKISPEFEGDVKEMIVYDLWIEGFGK